MSLLIESADAPMTGFLEITDGLYLLAGARSRSYFELKFWTGLVGACFERSTVGGRDYIHNPVLVEVITTQLEKMGNSSLSLSLLKKAKHTDLEELEAKTGFLFGFYSELFQKSKTYKLTEKRKKAAQTRLLEFMADNTCDLETAIVAAQDAMKRLRASDWHTSKGFVDWYEQIFRSKEEFQKRLEMKNATPISGKGSYAEANAGLA